MLGSASTQAFFASAKSINLIPTIYAEWNYNRFIQPYETSSHYYSPNGSQLGAMSTTLNSNATWSSVGSSNITITTNSSISSLFPPLDTTIYQSTCLSFSHSASTNYTDFTGIVKTSDINIGSSLIDNNQSFFKIVFWLKSAINMSIANNSPTLGTPTVTTGTASGTSLPAGTWYYKFYPVTFDGIRSSNVSSTSFTANGSNYPIINLNPDSTNNYSITSVDIYRSFNSNSNYQYLTSIANNYTGSIKYQDNLSAPDLPGNLSTFTNYINVLPSISIANDNGANLNSQFFVRSYSGSKSDDLGLNSTVQVDAGTWRKVEIWVKVTGISQPNNITYALSLMSNATFSGFNFYAYNFEVYKVSSNEYNLAKSKLTSVNSVFLPNQPGEALLNPLLPTDDKKIIDPISSASAWKQPSYLYYQNSQVSPYFLSDVKIPTSYDSFKYYYDFDATANSTVSIIARYPQPITINKIVMKFLNFFSGSSPSAVYTLYYKNNAGSAASVTLPPFAMDNSNGTEIMFLNSASSGSATNAWTNIDAVNIVPPAIPSDGQFTNGVLKNVYAISASINMGGTTIPSNALGLHLIEISPRLEINVSNITQNFRVSKESDSEINSMFPISLTTANSGDITLSNVPVYQILPNSSPFTIFDNNSSSATFYNMMRQNVKFTAFFTSPRGDISEKIPVFCMYSQNWSVIDISNISIGLYDYTKSNLMAKPAPSFLLTNVSFQSSLSKLLNYSGYSDYDYGTLLSNMISAPPLIAFFSNENQSVIEPLQDILKASQTFATVDEYGIMRFGGIDYNIKTVYDSNFKPDYLLTNETKSLVTMHSNNNSITFSPNFMIEGYQESIGEKVGRVVIKYVDVERSISDDMVINKEAAGYQTVTPTTSVWSEKESSGLSYFRIGSLQANSAATNVVVTTNKILTNRVGQFDGYFFVGGEIFQFNGIQYDFRGGTSSKSNFAASVSNFSYSSASGLAEPFTGSGTMTLTATSSENPPYANVYKAANNGLQVGDTISTYGFSNSANNGLTFNILDIGEPTFSGTSASINLSIQAKSSTTYTGTTGTASSSRLLRTFNPATSDATQQFKKTMYSQADVDDAKRLFFDSFYSNLTSLNTNDSNLLSLSFEPNGTLMNLKRASMGSVAKDHIILKPDASNAYDEISQNMDQYQINANTGVYTVNKTAAVTSAGSVKISGVGNANIQTVVPKFTSANMNFMSIIFKSLEPSRTKTGSTYNPYTPQRIGIFFEMPTSSPATNTYFVYVEPNETKATKTFTTKVFLAKIDSSNNFTVIDSDIIKINMFDGKNHKIAFHITDSGAVKVFWNEQVSKSITLGTSGVPTTTANKKFGAFIKTNSTTDSVSAYIHEIYAAQWVSTNGNYDFSKNTLYHFLTPTFLDSIRDSGDVSSYQNYYLWQYQPICRGIKIYEDRYSTAPIDGGATISVPVYGSSKEGKDYTSVYNGSFFGSVIKDDYAISNLKTTDPFKFKFVVANNGSICLKDISGAPKTTSNQMIFLNTANGSISDGVSITPISISARFLNISDPPKIYESILDAATSSTSIELTSNWIHGRQRAIKIADSISKLLSSYYASLSIETFGNPLIQSGDIAFLHFSLKGINYIDSSTYPFRYFTKKIDLSYDGTGVTTKLDLKPIRIN